MSVYNGEANVARSIESILRQSYCDFEFIIVDDGSTDATSLILSSFAKQDSRIVVVSQTNQGLTVSLNNAFRLAQGEYVARMDSGDFSHPRRFETQVSFLDEHSDVGVVGSWYNWVSNEHSQEVHTDTGASYIRWRLLFHSPFAHASAMIRSSLLREVDGYDTRFRYSQDYALWTRLSSITKLENIPEFLLDLRRASGSDISAQYKDEQWICHLNVAQESISQLLSREIPRDQVEQLHRFAIAGEPVPNHEASALICLTQEMYRRFVSEKPVSRDDLRSIQRDVARIIWGIARPRIVRPAMLMALLFACRLDRRLLRSTVTAPFRRIRDQLR